MNCVSFLVLCPIEMEEKRFIFFNEPIIMLTRKESSRRTESPKEPGRKKANMIK